MSISPPLRRLSSTSSSSKESLINAYEAEEERIINILSRKLERLREEKIELENALEAESEYTVNRLSREISALRLAQQQQQQQGQGQVNGSGTVSPVDYRGPLLPAEPTTEMMLEAMRRENEQLRRRLVDTERDYIRITRLNEIYREELIEHRRRLGLPVDNLIGLASPLDPYTQPIHLHAQSNSSSVSTSPYLSHSPSTHTASARVPIPRPPSQIRRPIATNPSPGTTPPSSSSASASLPSPFPFSPPADGTSAATSITTPGSVSLGGVFANGTNPHELTYPSVPPPSLSSSYGEGALAVDDSPQIQPTGAAPVPIPHSTPRLDADPALSPITGSIGSFGGGAVLGPLGSPRRHHALLSESPNGRTGGGWVDGFEPTHAPQLPRRRGSSVSRGGSCERGFRIAETGRLVPRSRRQSAVENQTATSSSVHPNASNTPDGAPGTNATARAQQDSGSPAQNAGTNEAEKKGGSGQAPS